MKKIIKTAFTAFLWIFIASFTSNVYSGDNLFIDKGETESFELSADTYQGYEWVIASSSDPTIAKYEGKEFEYGEKNTDLSVQKLKFRGLKKGKTVVTLQYIKQGDMVPKKTKTVTIRVY